MTALTGILDDIANAVGVETANEIARTFGGQRIYVPKNPTETNPLAQLIGVEKTRRIARLVGYKEFIIPLGNHSRAQVIRRLLAEGVSQNEIARRTMVTLRNVEHHAQKMRQEGRARGQDRQLDLPLEK